MSTLSLKRKRLPGIVLLLLISMAAPATLRAGVTQQQQPQETRNCVILLHGLWRSSWSMNALQRELERADYDVVNQSYPSREYPVSELAEMAVEAGLTECRAMGAVPVNFVTHSLGGILVRQYLAYRDIPDLRRVVMLGPPNRGSQMADYAMSMEFLQPYMPPAIAQLGRSESSVPGQLGRVEFELGVIAGTVNRRSFMPGAPEVPSDGTVTVAETIVPGMADFIELPVTHTFMMWDDSVIEQTLHFLSYGVFKSTSPPFISP